MDKLKWGMLLVAGVLVAFSFVLFAYVRVLYQSSEQSERGGQAQLSQALISVDGNEFLVEVAQTPDELRQGLSFRKSLGPMQGMLFVFPEAQTQQFWMYGMQFPLDIIFLDGNRIVSIEHNVPVPNGGIPAVVASGMPADRVLEMNAGVSKSMGIEVGDEIR